MTHKMEWRETYLCVLPLDPAGTTLQPEKAILQFPDGRKLDVGALCYLKRVTPSFSAGGVNRNRGRPVALVSLCHARVERVRALIQHISDEIRCNSRRVETIRTGLNRFMAFMAWADERGCHKVLDNRAAALPILRKYVDFVRDCVARNKIKLNEGARQQSIVVAFLERFLEIDDLAQDLFLLRHDSNSSQSTSPPSDEAQGKMLSLCNCIFQSLSLLSIDNLTYPYSMAMPKYLDFPQDRLWVFPTNSWFNTPAMEASVGRWGVGYNYSDGRVATIDEVTKTGTVEHPGTILDRANHQLNSANTDAYHPSRLKAAKTVMAVYTNMFLASTGMNWAQMVNLTWANDFEVGVTHQSYREIKWRADGKLVSFILPIEALPAFRRFLDIRKYLLRSNTCNFLFFSMDSVLSGTARKVKGTASTYKMLRRIDPNLSKIRPGQWRTSKSHWLINNTDVSTAALILQNTESTILKSYAEGSEITQRDEMGDYFEQVSNTLLAQGTVIIDEKLIAVGKCLSFGKPAVIQILGATPPNCRGGEGCLFCDKLKVHADEQDIRKLLSCRHCLRRTAALFENKEHELSVLNPLLKRIDSILSEIAQSKPEMVAWVTKEVDEEGELDPYWGRKLEIFIELGVFS